MPPGPGTGSTPAPDSRIIPISNRFGDRILREKPPPYRRNNPGPYTTGCGVRGPQEARDRWHVKFLGRGSGSAGAAAEYLLEERNAAGEEREEVEVLPGDPWRVAEVADSLEFEYRYTSGVIAWAPEDEPSEDQIEQTLEEFERTAWAGLEGGALRLVGGAASGDGRRRTRACAGSAV